MKTCPPNRRPAAKRSLLLSSATVLRVSIAFALCVGASWRCDATPTPAPAPSASPETLKPWGEFEGRVNTHRPKRGDPDFDPEWPDWQEILLQDFHYVDRTGTRWTAPKGDRLDGASIPSVLWGWMFGTPHVGPYFEASVLHDAYCYRKAKNMPGKERDWSAIHKMFYEAMRCGGTGEFEAKTKYWAVRKFGPPSDRTIWKRLFGSPDDPASTPSRRGPAAQLLERSVPLLADAEKASFFAGMTAAPAGTVPGAVEFHAPAGAQQIAATRLAMQAEMLQLYARYAATSSATTQIGAPGSASFSGAPVGGSARIPPEPTLRHVEVKPESFLAGSAFLTTEQTEEKEVMEAIIYIAQNSDRLSTDDIDRLAQHGVPETPPQ